MIYDRTRESVDAALLQAKPKRSLNPLHYAWTAWENFAYLLAPANGCQYCWVLRAFLVGLVLGVELMWAFPKIKFW